MNTKDILDNQISGQIENRIDIEIQYTHTRIWKIMLGYMKIKGFIL